jgi:hypothetical protein
MKPILFCNIAWMKHYKGTRGDPPKSSASYIREHGTGSENHNFNPTGGSMRGFVQVTGTINLKRLGTSNDDDFIAGATVVWIAPSPLGGTVIVGWYRNATIYKEVRVDHRVQGRDYNIVAKPKDCVLLPIDRRIYAVPRGKGGIGQSCVWYADNTNPRFRRQVISYIQSNGTKMQKAKKHTVHRPFARNADPLRMQKVETTAVRAIVRHYKKLGYVVDSVEKDNLGWDLQAFLNASSFLRLEVKGLSGSQVSIELTPNEYRNMERYRDTYRVCIVSDALKRPSVYIFSYSPDHRQWEDSDGRVLRVQRITSARMFV